MASAATGMPNAEIALWLHIGEMYKRLTDDKLLTPAEKGDVFRILLACANNLRDQVMATARVQVLSRPEAEAVMAEFYKAGLDPSRQSPQRQAEVPLQNLRPVQPREPRQ